MSARVARRDEIAATLVIVAVGIVMLVARAFVTWSNEGRVAPFAAAYVALTLASIALPATAGRTAMSPFGALGVGIFAVGIAAVVAGRPVPAPWGTAVLPLSLLAAIAEEALFRRAAYSTLERFGTPAAAAGSALLFALVHVPAYGWVAFPVDLGAGLLFAWQRWASGSWTVPAATHAAANALAVLR